MQPYIRETCYGMNYECYVRDGWYGIEIHAIAVLGRNAVVQEMNATG